MPQITETTKLRDFMWANAEEFAVFVVDEDDNVDGDGRMNDVTQDQIKVLTTAKLLEIPVFLTKLAGTSFSGFLNNYTDRLNAAITPTNKRLPDGTKIYEKNNESYPGGNAAFEQHFVDVQPSLTRVVIMGQSTNACVKLTGCWAARHNLTVHTAQALLRHASGQASPWRIDPRLWDLDPAYGGLGDYHLHLQV